MIIKRRVLTPEEQARFENAEAQVKINRAIIDYIAMMTDVEIPIEEDEDEPEI